MSAKRMLLVCMEAVTAVAVIGCAPTIMSTDAGVYQNGTLYATSSRTMDAVYSATLQAMENLQLEVTDKAKDVFAAKVIAKSADDKIVVVKIQPEEDEKTSYNIRVGTLGNEERSQKIYNEIVANLAQIRGK